MYAELCRKLWSLVNTVRGDERGVTSIEYAVLAALIVIALSLAFGANSGFFSAMFAKLSTNIQDAMTS